MVTGSNPVRIAKFAEYGRGLSAWSHKPRIAGSNPASATKPAEVTLGYCDPQEGEMSSSLMGGSGQTEPALAMRQSSLVEKWMEGLYIVDPLV